MSLPPGSAKGLTPNQRAEEIINAFEQHHNVQLLKKSIYKAFTAVDKQWQDEIKRLPLDATVKVI